MFGFLKCTSVPGQWWVSWLVCFLMVSYPQMFHIKSQILHFNVTKVFSGPEVFGLWGIHTEFAKFLKINFRTFFFWSRSFIDPFSCVCVWTVALVEFFFFKGTHFLIEVQLFFSNLFYWTICVRITPGIFSPFYQCREVINYNAKSICLRSHTHINTIDIGFLIHGFNMILPSGKVFHKV